MKSYFKKEEKFMEEINYPEYKEHLRLHNEIIDHCNELVLEVNTMEDSLFEKELAKLIDVVLIQHILKEDDKLVVWAKNI